MIGIPFIILSYAPSPWHIGRHAQERGKTRCERWGWSRHCSRSDWTHLQPGAIWRMCSYWSLKEESNVAVCVLVEVRCENPSELISQPGFLPQPCSTSPLRLFTPNRITGRPKSLKVQCASCLLTLSFVISASAWSCPSWMTSASRCWRSVMSLCGCRCPMKNTCVWRSWCCSAQVILDTDRQDFHISRSLSKRKRAGLLLLPWYIDVINPTIICDAIIDLKNSTKNKSESELCYFCLML